MHRHAPQTSAFISSRRALKVISLSLTVAFNTIPKVASGYVHLRMCVCVFQGPSCLAMPWKDSWGRTRVRKRGGVCVYVLGGGLENNLAHPVNSLAASEMRFLWSMPPSKRSLTTLLTLHPHEYSSDLMTHLLL